MESERTSSLMQAMAEYFGEENKDQVTHFQSVWLYAKTIAAEEGLDEDLSETIEIAAIVHDISCPLCRRKYGSAEGKLQEKESYPLVKEFLSGKGIPDEKIERIAQMVSRHHTYEGIDGMDLQVLIEADALVNLNRKDLDIAQCLWFGANVFKTKTGSFLLEQLIASSEEEDGKN